MNSRTDLTAISIRRHMDNLRLCTAELRRISVQLDVPVRDTKLRDIELKISMFLDDVERDITDLEKPV